MSGAKDGSVSAKYKYDVFFSLSHQDRNIHTDHFYKALVDAGFRTIRDGDPIDRSEDIKSDLKRAIEQSRISVIILSKNYASSKWCLDQLVMIIDCKRDVILPVFYDVDRFEVGDIKGRIGEAFDRYEEELKVETDDQRKEKLTDKIKRWREALSFAADVPEFVLQNQAVWDESKFIQNIIGAIEEKLKVVQEDFVPMEVETEGGLLNQDTSSLVQEWNVVEINLMNIEELPENPKCPVLVKLFLQQSYDLTEIPDSFFESMPVLQVLDLSNTSIKTLPRSIASLVKLQEFLLRDCELLRELPPEIGELENLEVFDLEGTELMCLPKEIERLLKLKCLKVSLCRCADYYIERKGIEAIIPRATLSKFSQLKELRILVDPDCEWWDAEVEAIIDELSKLRNLEMLQLYFPTVKLLQKFVKFPSNVYQNLSNFRLTVGRHEQQIISSLPRKLQSMFEKLDKCLKYVNGKGNTNGIGEALKHARALFLDRQWTIEKLSAFKIHVMHHLSFCLVVECNEMDTIVDGDDFYQEGDNGGKPILESLHYLSLHYMKNLQSIWKGPIVSHCLSSLEILVLHTCPELTTIFNLALLCNLINLKELIVENCPKVKILVSAEPSHLKADYDFLPALEKILIVDLPALVSISGGLQFGPKLESIVFSNCPMLKNLSPTDMYNKYMHEIKVDSSSSETDYLHCASIPVTSYGDLMEQIKGSGKSLYEPSSQNQVVPAQRQWQFPPPFQFGDGRRRFGSNMVFRSGVPISLAAVTKHPSSLSLSLDEDDALWQMNSWSRETMESGPYPVREGKPDCIYYIKTGLCGYGGRCQFNHPPNRKLATASARTNDDYPERIGQPECQYYLKTGTCKFGYTCKFHHPRDKAGIAGRVSLNYVGYPLRPNETECASYMRTGQCKFGSTCKFHHPQPSNMMVSFRGFKGIYSSYHSGYVPARYLALQRENVFPQRHGQPECQFYMKTGDCKFGASCRYHHPRERLIPAPDCVLSPMGLPLRPGEPLCTLYSHSGICKFGPSCKFDHPMGVGITYYPSTSPSADVPGPVVQRLLGSSSATDALTSSSEAGSAKPRRHSLS